MTHYTIVPEEIYLADEANDNQYEEVEISGIVMQVRMEPGNNKATIVRLLRCNLDDYLNPAYSPGQQILYTPTMGKLQS